MTSSRLFFGMIVPLALAVSIASCASGAGTAFETTVSAESGPAVSAEASSEVVEEDAEEAVLVLRSRPSGAAVFLDGAFRGTTPLSISNIEPGTYQVSLRAEGYADWDEIVRIEEDRRYELEVRMRRLTGILVVDMPDDADLYVDGIRVEGDAVELPVGDRQVRVERFGFEPVEEELLIEDGRITRFEPDFEPADFEFRDLRVDRERFYPENAGVLGRTTIRFSVPAPGSGRLVIRGPGGETVLARRYSPFDRVRYSLTWDGRDSDGEILPPGTYTIVLEGSGTTESGEDLSSTLTREVVIDPDYRIRLRSLWSGFPGLLYAPLPDTLPPGSAQAGTALVVHLGSGATAGQVRVPTVGSARIGLPAGFQVHFAGTAVASTEADRSATFLTLGASRQFLDYRGDDLEIGLGVGLRTSVLSPLPTDSFASFDGVALSVPFTASIGPLGLAISPEVLVSPERVSYEADEAGPAMGSLGAWGYGKAGIYLDFPGVFAGLSASLRTLPFGPGFDLGYPVLFGAEAHVLLPGSNTFLSALGTMEVFADGGYFISAGAGFGLIF